ncbi:non-ribosomal peptide synthetase, partial [Saccharothrix sp. MB29]|nr:non-ribosomal peptide synthetase [Saccharothrix sp. MB29]
AGVRDAAVVVTEGDAAEKRLVAAVVSTGTVRIEDLRDRVAEQLPAYMVPTLWAVVDRVPVTGNGKVDRRALAAAALPAGQHAPAPEPVGAEFFARALGRDAAEVTADTDFFTV